MLAVFGTTFASVGWPATGASPSRVAAASVRSHRFRYDAARPPRSSTACTMPSPMNQWYVSGSGSIGFGPTRRNHPFSSGGSAPVTARSDASASVPTAAKLPARYGFRGVASGVAAVDRRVPPGTTSSASPAARAAPVPRNTRRLTKGRRASARVSSGLAGGHAGARACEGDQGKKPALAGVALAEEVAAVEVVPAAVEAHLDDVARGTRRSSRRASRARSGA